MASCTLKCPVHQRLRRLLVPILAALLCAAAAFLWQWSPGRSVTEDRNGDGHPDVWRTYDRQGRLSEVAIDTNFDGRSDVHEYYENGALVSRASDRNFDDRVDLVQQFDYTTHDQVRAVEDVDYDGTADLLVLFQGGRPVFSRWADRGTPGQATPSSSRNRDIALRTAADPLTRFDDPFENDLAFRAVRLIVDVRGCVGSAGSGWLPVTGFELVDRFASPSALKPVDRRHLASPILDAHAPRGPPLTLS